MRVVMSQPTMWVVGPMLLAPAVEVQALWAAGPSVAHKLAATVGMAEPVQSQAHSSFMQAVAAVV